MPERPLTGGELCVKESQCLLPRRLRRRSTAGAVGEGAVSRRSAAAMIAQLKYGSGTPFYRLEQLQGQLGIPLPAATQWDVVEEAAKLLKPVRDELIRQAAQGEVLHNDDTSMRVLHLTREPSDKRTGVFTSGIVSGTVAYMSPEQLRGKELATHRVTDVPDRNRSWFYEQNALVECPGRERDRTRRELKRSIGTSLQ